MIVDLKKAISLIRDGDVVAIPTETVYGLAGDAKNALAVQKIFNTKGRPADNPLIVHISSIDQLHDFAESIPDDALQLADKFWPGPLTLILKRKPTVLDIVTAGLDTVAIRMPNHPIALKLIQKTGPVTAPSANRSGKPSPTNPEHIKQDYGTNLPILDGGKTDVGIESTVLDLSELPYRILRPGVISKEELSTFLGQPIERETANRKSPGTRHTHYKPTASVKWLDERQSIIKSHKTFYILHHKEFANLPENAIHFRENYQEFARLLYDLYRTADQKGFSQILIEPFTNSPSHPLIDAIINRIQHSVNK